MRLRITLALIGLLMLGILLAAPATMPARAQESPGDPEAGAALFAENCVVCHGSHGEGRIGATLDDVFVSMNADVALTEVITNGRPGTFMPPWGSSNGGPLSDEDIQNLVAYIESWGTTYEPPEPAPPRTNVEIPPVAEVDGDPNNGYTIFQQNCAACHGESGEGRVGATLTTAFASIAPGAFALETISGGVEGSLMPAWSQDEGGPLTDQEINDVAAYVLSIQRQPSEQPGEQMIPPGSAWPLIAVGILTVIIVVALGIAVNRRQSSGG